MGNKVIFIAIDPSQAGQKLIAFLQRNLRNQSTGVPLPLGLLHKLIRSGQVRVNKGRIKSDYVLSEGDRVRLPPLDRVSLSGDSALTTAVRNDSEGTVSPVGSASASGEGGKSIISAQIGECLVRKCPEIQVVCESDDYLVINKPGGIPVHGGSRHKESIIAYVLQCRQPGEGFTPTLAHRLDKDTSGVLLVAKTYRFLRQVQDSLKEGGSQKFYLAWVAGHWPHEQALLLEDHLSKKADAKGAEKVTSARQEEGSLCRSVVTPLRFEEKSTLLKIELLTGRTHQIRVQLALRGHSIFGDYKYGGQRSDQGMLLHSWSFAIPQAGLKFVAFPSWSGEFSINHFD